MEASQTDMRFAGSIPEIYDRLLVPLLFAGYARDLAGRVAGLYPARVLEIAAGTGAATRALSQALPGVALVATDLNQPMLDRAMIVGTPQPVQWQQADVARLPFEDASFDVAVCQFGAMFFPDKVPAFAEVRRVLRPGGTFVLNVWDRLENNDFAHAVSTALGGLFAADPPQFMRRVPHGYFDRTVVEHDLEAAGFAVSGFETLALRSLGDSAQAVAVAFCQGTPVCHEIMARGGEDPAQAVQACAAAIRQRFGTGAVEGRLQAHIVTAQH